MGIKRKDLRPCVGCGNGVMHNRSMAFYEATIGYRLIDPGAVQREAGLEMMMGGNAALAAAFSPDPDLAMPVGDDQRVFVCLSCAMTKSVAELAKLAGQQEDDA